MVRKPLHPLNVQVVRGFVQHHQVQLPHQCRRQVHPALFPARQLPHLGIQPQSLNAQAVKHFPHPGV